MINIGFSNPNIHNVIYRSNISVLRHRFNINGAGVRKHQNAFVNGLIRSRLILVQTRNSLERLAESI